MGGIKRGTPTFYNSEFNDDNYKWNFKRLFLKKMSPVGIIAINQFKSISYN